MTDDRLSGHEPIRGAGPVRLARAIIRYWALFGGLILVGLVLAAAFGPSWPLRLSVFSLGFFNGVIPFHLSNLSPRSSYHFSSLPLRSSTSLIFSPSFR